MSEAVATGADPVTAAGEAVSAVIRVVRRLHTRLGEQVDDSAAYLLLHHIGASGPLRLTELSALVALDHSTVSRHVGRLLDAGRVERHPDPADRRAWRLTLTGDGRAVLDGALHRRAEMVADAISGWAESDREDLVRLLAALAADLDALDRPHCCDRPARRDREERL